MSKAIETMSKYGYQYNASESKPDLIRFDFSASGFTTFASWKEVTAFIESLIYFM